MQKTSEKNRTAKLLDASKNYWRRRGVTDWRIVVEKKEDAEGEATNQVAGEQES